MNWVSSQTVEIKVNGFDIFERPAAAVVMHVSGDASRMKNLPIDDSPAYETSSTYNREAYFRQVGKESEKRLSRCSCSCYSFE